MSRTITLLRSIVGRPQTLRGHTVGTIQSDVEPIPHDNLLFLPVDTWYPQRFPQELHLILNVGELDKGSRPVGGGPHLPYFHGI